MTYYHHIMPCGEVCKAVSAARYARLSVWHPPEAVQWLSITAYCTLLICPCRKQLDPAEAHISLGICKLSRNLLRAELSYLHKRGIGRSIPANFLPFVDCLEDLGSAMGAGVAAL